MLQDEATSAWKKAKEAKDYSIFEPYLTRIVEYNRKLAGYVNPGMKTYDALLDLYEEGLDSGILSESVRQIQKADMLIIGGTSLVVYPAAGLADYFSGKYLVVLNLSPTHQDEKASLCIARPIGQVLRETVLEGDYGTV